VADSSQRSRLHRGTAEQYPDSAFSLSFCRKRQTAKTLHRAAKDYPVRSSHRSALLNR
jgi:hypothetical protein